MIPGMNVGGMMGGMGGQQAAPGFQMPMGPAVNSVAPFQMLSPEQLAALAARAFQPPGGGGAPSLGGGGGGPGGPQPDYAGFGKGLGTLTDFLTNGKKQDLKEGVKPSITNPSYGDLGGPGGTYASTPAANPGWWARNIGTLG